MSKAYVIGNITITNADGYAHYSARVPAVVAAFGGRYRVRGGIATTPTAINKMFKSPTRANNLTPILSFCSTAVSLILDMSFQGTPVRTHCTVVKARPFDSFDIAPSET